MQTAVNNAVAIISLDGHNAVVEFDQSLFYQTRYVNQQQQADRQHVFAWLLQERNAPHNTVMRQVTGVQKTLDRFADFLIQNCNAGKT